jgi:hypothetical protein
MPKIIIPRDFWFIDIELDEPKIEGKLSDDLQDTLARLAGWYDAGKTFKKVNVDSQGRLLVSLNAGQIGNLSTSKPAVAAVAVKLLDANINRRRWEIRNNGVSDVAWGVDNSVTLANGVTLGVGQLDGDDVYIGALWAISSAAGATLTVIEE